MTISHYSSVNILVWECDQNLPGKFNSNNENNNLSIFSHAQ